MNFTIDKLMQDYEDCLSLSENKPYLSWLFVGNPNKGIEKYYYFLNYIVGENKLKTVVELGTDTGISAKVMAEGNNKTTIYTIDNDWKAKENLDTGNRFDNIVFIYGDAGKIPNELQNKKVDLLFIDADHYPKSLTDQFLAWYPKVVPGGLILFDDAKINDDMFNAIICLTEKVNRQVTMLDNLHHSGFAAMIK